jgi:predicted phosphoadenosine phosphosulfate sulfurtransferase
MSRLKKYNNESVLDAAIERIKYTFDNFESIYLSFSGGKDSSVMFHLVMDEAIKRNRVVGILIIDLEAQYTATIKHIEEMIEVYKENIEVFWVCLPISLRNAVSNYQPKWTAWGKDDVESWVREKPKHDCVISDSDFFPFFYDDMEFEEFIILFGDWYNQDEKTACFVGIRCDESLNRFRTIASKNKERFNGKNFTTKVLDGLYNIYPLYDWKTSDIWRYHYVYPDKYHNVIYDQMYKAGVKPSQMRLCQPYGDDQRRGLWLYHILETDTWYKLIARVNGVNSGALYIQENGNVTGYNKIYKPEGHTWKSFCKLLLRTMPKKTRDHYLERFIKFISGWKRRGYETIPDEAPKELENRYWAPSWRRLCKVLLRNDYWCKGLGMTQPKSEAYKKYIEIKKQEKKEMMDKKLHLIKNAFKCKEIIICNTKKEAKDIYKTAMKNNMPIFPPKPLELKQGELL